MNQPSFAHATTSTGDHYRLWVNDDRTILVRVWPDGACEVAVRGHESHTWGPPMYLMLEKAA